MILFKKNLYKLVSIIYFIFLPIVSFAVDGDGSPCVPSDGKICNPVPSIKSVPGLVQTILTGLLQIGIPVVALAVVYCGFLFVAARGSPEKITKAKDALLYTVIGAAILLGAWAIATMISTTVTGLSATKT